MSYIIAIGRQYGSGGRYIAQELAKKLNINFYDNSLLEKVAQDSGLCVDFIKSNEEKKDSVFSFLGLHDSTNYLTSSQRVALAQFDTIEKIAQSGESCVIVGRCADYVLRKYPNLVSVFICAPIENRVVRATTYYGLDEKKAAETIKKMDKKRASYYNYFTDKNWGEAESYDLCINSSIGIEESVQVIADFVQHKISSKK
jgi:CMP/dCMP kinase